MDSAHRRLCKRTVLLVVACALAAASTGCGRGGWGDDDADAVPFTPHAAPVALDRGVRLNYSGASGADDPQALGYDPQLSRGGDPLVDSADPLSSPQRLASASRLDDARDPAAAKSGAQTQGWYWVVGTIQSGEIGIAVNGTPIGRYSVHVDKEITAYCHPGLNTLTFTHYPLLGAGQPECAAHLEIVNGNAAKGAPPLMTYDTEPDARSSASATVPTSSAAPPPAAADPLSATSADADGDAETAGETDATPALAPPVPGGGNSPYSDVRTFSGN